MKEINNISNNSTKVKMFFFPYIAGGHLLPMIDKARFFASCHPNVQATIIATPKNAQLFQPSIDRDRELGLDISFHSLEPPNKSELGVDENFLSTHSVDERTKAVTAVRNLREPLRQLLLDTRPDCLVSDIINWWTLEIAKEIGIPCIIFYSNCLFSICVEDVLSKFKPHHKVGSDSEPFLLDGLTHPVKFTKLRLPVWHRTGGDTYVPCNLIRKATEKSYSVILNSCDAFEGDFRSHAESAFGTRVRMVGPVSIQSNRNANGRNLEGESILSWLDSKERQSVLYVCFGTDANFSKAQFHEIAHGLENLGQSFIWVCKPNLFKDQGEEGWFPDGFESRVRDSNQGVIIKGWAPQTVILAHPNVGVFLTHCGWNSSQEGLWNELVMITWPLTHDQFYGESLLVDVLKVGIRVGNEEWVSSDAPPKVMVTRDKLEAAVRRVMGGGEEVDEFRRNVKEHAKKCKVGVQKGGTSFEDAYALVEELKALRDEQNNT